MQFTISHVFLSANDAAILKEKQRILSKLNDTILIASSANRTPDDTIWLFFNRIPRTGGSSLVAILNELGDYYYNYKHQEHYYRTPWQR